MKSIKEYFSNTIFWSHGFFYRIKNINVLFFIWNCHWFMKIPKQIFFGMFSRYVRCLKYRASTAGFQLSLGGVGIYFKSSKFELFTTWSFKRGIKSTWRETKILKWERYKSIYAKGVIRGEIAHVMKTKAFNVFRALSSKVHYKINKIFNGMRKNKFNIRRKLR